MRVRDRIKRWLDTTDTTESPLSLNNLNFDITNNILYSYGDHWPLAYRYRTLKDIDENTGQDRYGWSILVNRNNYSGQTSVTRQHLDWAIENSQVNYDVYDIGGRQQHGKAYTPCACRLMFAMIPQLANGTRHYTGANHKFAGNRIWRESLEMLKWEKDDNHYKRQSYSHSAIVANEINRLQLDCLFNDVLGRKNTPHQKKKQVLKIAEQPLKALKDMYREHYIYDSLHPAIKRLNNKDRGPGDLYHAWRCNRNKQFSATDTAILKYAMKVEGVTETDLEKQHTINLIKEPAQ